MTDSVGMFKSRHIGKRLALLATVLALFIVGCSNSGPDPEKLIWTTYNTGFGFSMVYPESWTQSILSEGLIAFGEAEDVAENTVSGEAARTIVVFRRSPQGFESLEAEFERYVEAGPESSGFISDDGIRETKLDGRPAYEIKIRTDPELIESEDRPDTTLYIIAAYADNGVTYYITATAPTEQWQDWWPVYQVAIASFEFLE